MLFIFCKITHYILTVFHIVPEFRLLSYVTIW